MKTSELNASVAAYKEVTRDALQLLFGNVNKGQRKQLVKREEIKALFDRFGVNYDE